MYSAKNAKVAVDKAVAVFVGGTSGIGEHTAYAFAKYVKVPTVYIVGRNETRGNSVVDQLRTINNHTDAKYTFIKGDATLVTDTDRVCAQILQDQPRIHLLFLSPGFLTFAGRTESVEGLDTKLAVNYYCRWRYFDRLSSALVDGANDPPGAHVSSILAAGTTEGELPKDDLALKHHFSLYRANVHIVTCTSSAVWHLSQVYPTIAFSHINPGFIRTDISRGLPLWARVPSKVLMRVFATDPAHAAERFYFLAFADPDKKTGAHILDASDKDVASRLKSRGVLDGVKEDRIWQHTKDVWANAAPAR